MTDIKRRIEENLADLHQEWDELRVKLHLANMEVDDEWDKIEAQLAQLQFKAKEVGTAAGSARENISAAAKLLAEEITKSFGKIREKL